MQFAMYLVDNGVISSEEFFEALKLQTHTRPQLGALAIEAQKLTFRDLSKILEAQCEEPDALFGELAVRLGYLTEADLNDLLAEQTARAKPITEVMVENGILTAEAAEEHYAEYRRCMQPSKRELQAAAT